MVEVCLRRSFGRDQLVRSPRCTARGRWPRGQSLSFPEAVGNSHHEEHEVQ